MRRALDVRLTPPFFPSPLHPAPPPPEPRRAKVHWIRAVDGHVAAEVPYADEAVLRVPAVSLEGRGGRPYAVAELRRGGEAYYVYLPAPAYYVRELSLLIFRPPPPLDVVKRHAERGRPDA